MKLKISNQDRRLSIRIIVDMVNPNEERVKQISVWSIKHDNSVWKKYKDARKQRSNS